MAASSRELRWAFLVFTLALASTGCRPDAPVPPDPNASIPEVFCDESAPLTLTSSAPDSNLDEPSWLQVCSLCPATTIEFIADDDNATELQSMWGAQRSCGYALASTPLPDATSFHAEARIETIAAVGSVSLEMPLGDGRGPNPEELGAATFVVVPTAENLRVPAVDPAALGIADFGAGLLIAIEGDPTGQIDLRFGLIDPETGEQDLCVPTPILQAPATMDRRQVGAELSPGDTLLLPGPGGLARGALQARLNVDGTGLQGLTVLGTIDLQSVAAASKTTTELLCATWEEAAAEAVCAPCDPPDAVTDSPSESLAQCLPMLWEFESALLFDTPLIAVDDAALPEDCSEEERQWQNESPTR